MSSSKQNGKKLRKKIDSTVGNISVLGNSGIAEEPYSIPPTHTGASGPPHK